MKPDDFLIAAAQARLFPRKDSFAECLDGMSVGGMTPDVFERRDYAVRHARMGDLPVLMHLEEACWPEGLRSSSPVIERRLERHPEGQLVLDLEGNVGGVIYSQHIASKDDFKGASADSVDRLHTAFGNTVHLLAINVLPEVQERQLGDQLLEFMLQYCRLVNGVESVVAVTRCRNYESGWGKSLEEYIHARNEFGILYDPILRFHEVHGARIEGLIPGYRPADRENEGCGVLVAYDIHNRIRNELRVGTSAGSAAGPVLPDGFSLNGFIESAIKECLGRRGAPAFSFDRPFMDMGLDSAALLALNEKISHALQIELGASFFFQYNTAQKVLSHFRSHILPGPQSEVICAAASSKAGESKAFKESLPRQASGGRQTVASSEAMPEVLSASSDVFPADRDGTAGTGMQCDPVPSFSGGPGDNSEREPSTTTAIPMRREIAVIGMACRLPGGVDTPGKLWEVLKRGESLVGELPKGRWEWPPGIDPEGLHRGISRGGFLEAIDCFDAPLFRIPPVEAEWMDPQQRILLELSWEAFEDAGYPFDHLAGSDTAVFIGASTSDYSLLTESRRPEVDAHWGTGNSMAVLANRISYFYDLQGPSLLIDTACSSSLVAVHKAVQSLQSGESSLALVGGVNVMCHPATTISYYRAGMLAGDGRCKTFNSRADGYVRAEGAVMLLLKPLDEAVSDGDPIYASIKGTACSHGGQAAGLTAPNPGRQAELLRQAWKNADISPETIGYIEAHGTGTSLGDPIEVEGIKEAFTKAMPRPAGGEKSCGLGSIKTNLGHLEAAAGIAGLMKAALSLKHRELVPSINFERLNPRIEIDGTPFFVADRHQEWPQPCNSGLRRAGISSFGSGGTNAHAILEEVREERPANSSGSGGLSCIVLSARDPERLRAYARRLLAFFETKTGDDISLPSVARTLQRRQAMEERVAFFVRSLSELKGKLEALALGAEKIEGSFRGNVGGGEELARLFLNNDMRRVLDKWVLEGKTTRAAELWVKGVPVNWELPYEGQDSPGFRHRRVHLPPYPFSRRRYWVSGPDAEIPEASTPFFRGMLRRDARDFEGDSFHMAFSGHEFFLKDHVVKRRKTLPGVVYLEMAWAAAALSAGGFDDRKLRLADVNWIQPLQVGEEPVRIRIKLLKEDCDRFGYRILSEPENGDETAVVHSRGYGQWVPARSGPKLDLPRLKKQCRRGVLNSQECYAHFEGMQIDYGPGHQGIEAVHAGSTRILARLSLPVSVSGTVGSYVLHPSVLDAALQAAILMASGATEGAPASGVPLLPFALEEMTIHGPCASAAWAWVRYASGSREEDRVPKYDIEMCDDEGVVCVEMKGFSLRPLEGEIVRTTGSKRLAAGPPSLQSRRTFLLAPVWAPVCTHEAGELALPSGKTVCVGSIPDAKKHEIEALFPGAVFLETEPGEAVEEIAGRIESGRRIDHVLWVAPDGPTEWREGDEILREQDRGVLQVFRLAKALLSLGYGSAGLSWTFVTTQTQAVFEGEPVHPAHAGVHGLSGSIAKEYPAWKVRTVDVESGPEWGLAGIFALPGDGRRVYAFRRGEWYRRELVPVREFDPSRRILRPGGVYVVIGGAGEIGRAWSREAIRECGAQIVWIGRRKKDATIQEKVDSLAVLGPSPEYISADASNPEELRRAYAAVKERYSHINGVIHSAMVLSDQSLEAMDEESFRAVFSSKADVSVRLAQVFRDEPLDFALFFSSVIVFVKNPNESHYAAGCAFQDAFALRLARDWHCAVKVIHWGYWENTWEKVSGDYLDRLLQVGVEFISPPEAMSAVSMLLGGPMRQMACMKAAGPLAAQTLNSRFQMTVLPETAPAISPAFWDRLPQCPPDMQELRSGGGLRTPSMDPLLLKILRAKLASMGLLGEPAWRRRPDSTPADCKELCSPRLTGETASVPERPPSGAAVCERYRPWIEESLAILKLDEFSRLNDGFSVENEGSADLTGLWREWERNREERSGDPDQKAQVLLLDACLKALPEILGGRRPATDVIFPESSMRLVEGIYYGNRVSDYFNEALSSLLARFLQERLILDPGAKIRVLEIGAGTGGTTSVILPSLSPFEGAVDEYAFTDVSKAFLLRAQERFGSRYSYLRTQIFDVEKPLAGQGIEMGRYDIVIATNVLHATASIRETVRNSKAALRRYGLLLLNELSGKSLFTHLTFGLLEGWWRCTDAGLRIPGCPGLTPDMWKKVLAGEGFDPVLFPLKEAHDLGQQLILAQSDGVLLQERVSARAEASPVKRIPAGAVESAPLRADDTGRLFLAVAPASAESAVPREEMRAASEAATIESLRERSVRYFKNVVASSLKMPVGEIDASVPLERYGIDSILVVQLTDALRKVFQDVGSTLFFEVQTIDGLAAHFVEHRREDLVRVLGDAGGKPGRKAFGISPPAARPMTESASRAAKLPEPRARQAAPGGLPVRDVAVIGLSGRYPLAGDVNAFWENLKSGRDCITEIPKTRWDWREYFDGEKGRRGSMYTRWGGFMEDVDKFDPLFFRISPEEAERMDPQERLFLEIAYASIEDSGYTPATLSGNGKVGVFVGVMNCTYTVQPHYWSIANRVSYSLDFQGPSMTVDTACSSSLTAIHLALESLTSGTCECAIAGGVNVIVDPAHYIWLSEMMMLSPGAECKSFGDSADGFVDGEGVGAVLLKPLDRAVADGDHIYGVIKGSMINAGGRTNGYTVPNPEAQFRAISEALDRAGFHARTVTCIEAHGTGTALGDPIEILGLRRAFERDSREKGFCAIGSVKSNIGHCESAAGIAGVTKILLQLKHGQIAPSLHSEALNPNIDFRDTPFVVQRELGKWKHPVLALDGNGEMLREYPRRAGVSSFGAGGSNAHVVVEEYVEPARNVGSSAGMGGPCLIVLSAKSEDRLKRMAENLHVFISSHSPVDLSSLAYTLQTGREAMEERLGFTAESVEEVTEKLKGFLDGRDDLDVYRGKAGRGRETLAVFTTDDDLAGAVDAWIAKGKVNRLLDFWVKGLSFDWTRLYGEPKPRRMSLPTYPFARESYWAPETGGRPPCVSLDAVEEIPHSESFGTLMCRPAWVEKAADGGSRPMDYAERLVMFCELESVSPGAIEKGLEDFTFVPLASGATELERRFEDISVQAFEIVKNLLQQRRKGKVLVQILVPSGGEGQTFAGLAGLLMTARLENPKIVGQLIEIDPGETEAGLAGKILENSRCPEDARILYGAGLRRVLTWKRVPVEREAAENPLKDGGVYLITGGMGGLGFLFAREIARRTRGASLVLTGRSLLNREKQERLKEIESLGATVEYRQADVSSPEDVDGLIQGILKGFGRLTGILHCAGIFLDSFILKKTVDEFRTVLASKVAGTVLLDRATRDVDLDFFVCFSSTAGAFGNAGQADYSTANAFMDAFAGYRNDLAGRRKRRCRILSINWPLWKDGGMKVDVETGYAMEQSMGMAAMESSTGIRAFFLALASGMDRMMVIEGNLPKIERHLSGCGPVSGKIPSPGSVSVLDGKTLCKRTLERLARLLGETIKLAPDRIDPLEPLERYGIDSITITRLNRKLERVLGPISKTLFFECATLSELAEHLVSEYPGACAAWTGGQEPATTRKAVPLKPLPASREDRPTAPTAVPRERDRSPLRTGAKPTLREPIAVIGMSGHYAQADTPDALWEILESGRDCITEIPADRWPLEGFFHPDPQEAVGAGMSYSKWGSFLEGFALFDPLFFKISPREAVCIDPQERLFLQASWEAVEDAGYTRETLQERCRQRVGVFAGITKTGFDLYGPELWRRGEFAFPHTSFASVANRVSYFLDLRGPSMSIDTMCSSSLTAVHEACEHLHRGECELAIAGGVNLYLHPSTYVWICAQRMLSRDNRCRSFGKGSSGFVPGEGVGVVLLKPLSRAIEDRDRIHAVIRSTSVNHDGKTNGYTVPSPKAQGELIREALERAGVHARTVSYIEAHGTGTALGDPVEISGLTRAFRQDTADTAFCAIGSVKSNLGHLEAAAGMAGLTKIILQMKHGRVAPSLHADELNPNIDFEKTPFSLQRELGEWKRPTVVVDGTVKVCPRIAGISSFGAGGSNAHAVIEEYVEETADDEGPNAEASAPYAIVLSARNEDRLKAYAGKLLAFIRREASAGAPKDGSRSANSTAVLVEAIRLKLSQILQVDRSEIEAEERFDDYGVEAVHRRRLMEELCGMLGLEADSDEYVERDSVAGVADILLKNHAGTLAAAGFILRDEAPVAGEAVSERVESPAIHPANLAYTLQIGREAMEERLGFVARSLDEIVEKLEGFLEGRKGMKAFCRGRAQRNRANSLVDVSDEDMARIVDSWIEKRKYGKLLNLWVKGMPIDWRRLYGEWKPRRIALPTYPFAAERYWLKVIPEIDAAAGPSRESKAGLTVMMPVCKAVTQVRENPLFPDRTSRTLVIGGTGVRQEAVRAIYPNAGTLDIPPDASVDWLTARFKALDPVDHVVWIAPDGAAESPVSKALILDQNRVVLEAFRTIKAFLAAGYALKDLGWTSITTQAMAVRRKDMVNPVHAGLHGLMGSLAKEYPHWKVRVLDMEAGKDWPVEEMFRLPSDAGGDALFSRGREWFRQSLIPVREMSGDRSLYRTDGVYVVIGGAGGIGEAWSRFMIERYRAKIIWIGRRKINAAIHAKLDALSSPGPMPVYIQADAADLESLQKAREEIKRSHAEIHGVVHSAIVLLDRSLANMDEERFRAGLSAKVDASVHLAQVFREEPLDFVLFFSALQSFVKAPGQSNYAAGCTFSDAFAQKLSREWSCAVKIVNWGYWGSIGSVATPFYRDRMKRLGLGSIEPEEGMDALDVVLRSPVDRLALANILES